MSGQDYYGGREPGTRRRKLAGYLKAANELRQSYQQQYAPGWSRREAPTEHYDNSPGSFPDAAVVRNGDEEMILFPSYARKHVKTKPQAEPGTIQEVPGDGRDVRDSTGTGDAEFWKQQWEEYEEDNAVVDVDVRGWIYSPHKGQMTRKQRLFVTLARQLVGIQAPPTGKQASSSPSPATSREPSPSHISHHERARIRAAQRDNILTAKEAEEILRRGEKEAEIAAKGEYSENALSGDPEKRELSHTGSMDSFTRSNSPGQPSQHSLSSEPSTNSLRQEARTALQKRASWNQPANMNAAELTEANAHLMDRLRHFLAIPMANIPISVFFYNDEISRQRTVYTNPSGHFNLRAALDFVPTHVRILASENLSVTEEIIITESKGISVISDIDDTIKHSAISSGAREIFRNAFIRELGDLTIEGVREWYGRMADMGVKFHYVSNSPWQIYPVISRFFTMAGLPTGSFHLKQYSGMLQGIFEPVAERKKGTLDKLARDFPERRFILIGDSGEADLEVYTDFVLENPGRVIAVFIRDVTTPVGSGFFDPSIGPMPGDTLPSSGQNKGTFTLATSSSNSTEEEDDPELRAAIAASIRDMEEENRKRSIDLSPGHDMDDHPESRPELPPRRTVQPLGHGDRRTSTIDEWRSRPTIRRVVSDSEEFQHRASVASTASTQSMPPVPRKPMSLRSTSGNSSSSRGPPPPKPRKSSSTIHISDSRSPTQSQHGPPAPPPPRRTSGTGSTSSGNDLTYAGAVREKASSAYRNLPAAPSYLPTIHSSPPTANSARALSTLSSSNSPSEKKPAPPPPPPPRRAIVAYPAAAAAYAGSKVHSAWNAAPALPYRSARPDTQMANAYSTKSTNSSDPTQYPYRTSNSGLGLNGGGTGTIGGSAGGGGPPPNKREVLWRQRWARAEQVLGEKGVVLKSWRVGTDVVDVAEKLIAKWEQENGIGNKKGTKPSDSR